MALFVCCMPSACMMHLNWVLSGFKALLTACRDMLRLYSFWSRARVSQPVLLSYFLFSGRRKLGPFPLCSFGKSLHLRRSSAFSYGAISPPALWLASSAISRCIVNAPPFSFRPATVTTARVPILQCSNIPKAPSPCAGQKTAGLPTSSQTRFIGVLDPHRIGPDFVCWCPCPTESKDFVKECGPRTRSA